MTTTRIRLSEGPAVGSVSLARATRPGGPPNMSLSIRPTPDGTNWSAEVLSVSSGALPASTYVLIRDSQGTTLLLRTPFSKLTSANWSTYEVEYMDLTPSSDEIRPADALNILRTTYPSGSTMEVSDDYGTLASRTLA